MDFLNDRHFVVVSCIRMPFAQVALAFEQQIQQWGYSCLISRGNIDVNSVCAGRPQVGGAHSMHVALLDQGTFTAMFTNYSEGWDSMAYCLSKALDCDAFVFTFCDDRPPEYPRNAFNMYRNGKLFRHVAVSYEGNWIFYEQGEPLPEEDVSFYKRKIKRERFDAVAVCNLASKLGFNIGSADFYRDKQGLLMLQQR